MSGFNPKVGSELLLFVVSVVVIAALKKRQQRPLQQLIPVRSAPQLLSGTLPPVCVGIVILRKSAKLINSSLKHFTHGLCGQKSYMKNWNCDGDWSPKSKNRSFKISTLLEERPTGSLWYSPLVLSRCRLRVPGLNFFKDSLFYSMHIGK